MRFDEPTTGRSAHAPTPRFCPRCRKAREGRGTLCPECGEVLAGQGYCPVCESHWALPAGSPCPKHELALEAGPPRGSGWAWTAEGSALVSVGSFASLAQAEAARLRLEAEGIPTFLQGERMGSASMYQVATGGVTIQVPEPLAADARILLAQTWAAPVEDDDLEDAWDELAPEPGRRRREVMKILVLVFLFGPLVLLLLQRLLLLLLPGS